MSRLRSYQQKQFRKKIVVYLILICALLFFMITAGFKILIGMGLFINSLANRSQPVTLEKKDDFYGNLTIDSIPQATNSAEINISGYVMNYEVVEFYINDEKVEEKKFKSSESFSQDIGNLIIGENTVYVKATSKQHKRKKESPRYKVVYKNEKPNLDITEPSSPSTTSKQDIKVSGKTDHEVFVKVNELPLVVNSEGEFQTNVRLREGENTITIVAEDEAGNTETKTLTVKYVKDE